MVPRRGRGGSMHAWRLGRIKATESDQVQEQAEDVDGAEIPDVRRLLSSAVPSQRVLFCDDRACAPHIPIDNWSARLHPTRSFTPGGGGMRVFAGGMGGGSGGGPRA